MLPSELFGSIVGWFKKQNISQQCPCCKTEFDNSGLFFGQIHRDAISSPEKVKSGLPLNPPPLRVLIVDCPTCGNVRFFDIAKIGFHDHQ
jgi:uncharacterized protein (DUF2225 family)